MSSYTEAEKKIFTFMRGGAAVHVDPLALRRKLLQASNGKFLELVGRAMEPDDPAAAETETEVLGRCDAQDKLLAVVRQAFELPAWDELNPGKGALDADCWRALNLYLEWLAKNARAAGSQPISPPPTASSRAPLPRPASSPASGRG